MSIKKGRLATLVAASAMFASVAAAAGPGAAMAATVFQNGSFEQGTFNGPTFGLDLDRVYAGSTDMTPWVVTTGSVDWINTYWQAAEGTKSVDLDGDEGTPGAISQTFDTTVNSTYVVTFAMSGNPDAGPTTKTINVSAGGVTTPFTYDTATNSTTRSAMNYVQKGFSFVGQANTSSSTITFTSTTLGGYGAVIDNVVITETLATGATCKNNGWKTMTDKFGTAFRNQGDCVSYYATGEKNLAF